MRRLAVWFVLAIGCAPSPPPQPVGNAVPPHAPVDDHDVLVTTVLQQYVAAPDTLADHGLLPASGPVYVAAEIDEHQRVHAVALPPGRFAIRTLADLQAEADRTKTNVAFIRFFDLTVDDATHAHVQVGVDIILPKQSQGIKMCCCSSAARWEKHGGVWAPGNTRMSICS